MRELCDPSTVDEEGQSLARRTEFQSHMENARISARCTVTMLATLPNESKRAHVHSNHQGTAILRGGNHLRYY